MTNQELISSGLLELYVAGTLSEEESIFITKKIETDSNLLEEVMAIEQTFCTYLSMDAPALSENVKNNILQNIEQLESIQHSSPVALKHNVADSRQIATPPLSSSKHVAPPSTIRLLAPYLAIAAVLILSMSIVLNTFFFGELKSINEQVALLEMEENTVPKVTQVAFSSSRAVFSKIPIQNIRTLDIKLIQEAPVMSAKLFLDQVGQNLFLDANSLKPPPNGKTWQVWTQTAENNQFHSLGVLTLEENKDNFFQLPSANNVVIQSIHLSIEPKGGSILPNQSEIYLSGKFF